MKWIPDNFKGIVSLIVILSSFTYFFMLHFNSKSADPQVIIAIVASMNQVLSYYFGSSQGANKKDQIISDMTSQTPAITSTGDINITQNKEHEKL